MRNHTQATQKDRCLSVVESREWTWPDLRVFTLPWEGEGEACLPFPAKCALIVNLYVLNARSYLIRGIVRGKKCDQR